MDKQDRLLEDIEIYPAGRITAASTISRPGKYVLEIEFEMSQVPPFMLNTAQAVSLRPEPHCKGVDALPDLPRPDGQCECFVEDGCPVHDDYRRDEYE